MRYPAWTAENEELLRRLWSEGLSASQIARRIPGMSREAVLGKRFRMKLPGRAHSASPRKPRRPNSIARLTPNVSRARAADEFPSPLPEGCLPFPSYDDALDIERLNRSHCRWPIEHPGKPTRYCGRQVDGGSLCPGHARIAYRGLPMRRAHSGFTLGLKLGVRV